MEALTMHQLAKRVVIIDDHAVINELLASVINATPGCVVVGTAVGVMEGLALCEREKPDLVVLDLVLPDASGLTALEQLRASCPAARIIVFSGNLTLDLIERIVAAGVPCVLSKGSTLEEFRAALLAVAGGRTYFSGEVAGAIRELVTGAKDRHVRSRELSKREAIILRYLAQGLSSRQIATELGVSVYTVANHRSRLMKKTGLHRSVQLGMYAASLGLIERPDETSGRLPPGNTA